MLAKLLFLVTEDWFFCSHFLDRAVAAQKAGHDVLVAAREGEQAERIRAAGLRFAAIAFERRSTNLFAELRQMRAVIALYRRERPHLVHQVAIKPILYGSLAARLTGIKAVVNAPVGMGYVFSSRDTRARLLRPFLKLAFRLLINPRGSRVIFENGDDLESFVRSGIVTRPDAVLIRGAGVNPAKAPLTAFNAVPPLVVMSARLLREKGIAEFVAAARKVKEDGIEARFVVLGSTDIGNPGAVDDATLAAWRSEGAVEFWGFRSDVQDILAQASIFCLPSYREGLPKAVLEAMAAGLPCVVTDVEGCREAVRHGYNGLLVPARDPLTLAMVLKDLISDPSKQRAMGARGRKRLENEFSSELIIRQTLDLYQTIIRE